MGEITKKTKSNNLSRRLCTVKLVVGHLECDKYLTDGDDSFCIFNSDDISWSRGESILSVCAYYELRFLHCRYYFELHVTEIREREKIIIIRINKQSLSKKWFYDRFYNSCYISFKFCIDEYPGEHITSIDINNEIHQQYKEIWENLISGHWESIEITLLWANQGVSYKFHDWPYFICAFEFNA